jgi:hypothetical protein
MVHHLNRTDKPLASQYSLVVGMHLTDGVHRVVHSSGLPHTASKRHMWLGAAFRGSRGAVPDTKPDTTGTAPATSTGDTADLSPRPTTARPELHASPFKRVSTDGNGMMTSTISVPTVMMEPLFIETEGA